MFLVIHGENTISAYDRLQKLRGSQKERPQILSRENTYDELTLALLSQSIFDNQNFVICYNFFRDKKIKSTDSLLKDDFDKTVVFYEETKLTPTTLTKLPKHITIEYFKAEPVIFWFLDSVSPDLIETLKRLEALGKDDEKNLIWNLSNRFLLLTLAQKNYSFQQVGTITGKPVALWQWQKCQSQSRLFPNGLPKRILSGLLKIDYMIKTGQTQLPIKTLLSYLLLKYLKA